MAQKRMFDKSILETDNFLNISLGAKALYFLLGMEADDEGFISPMRVLRLYGGEKGDLKNLIDVGLVIPFKSGVVVITDWNQNNWLDNRRIRPTQYQLEKKSLILTEQKKYELSNGLASAQLEESRIEENRVEENRKDNPKGLQQADVSLVECDDEGNEIKPKKKKNPDGSYGNPLINDCINFLREKLGGSPDGSIKENRQFAKLLIDKFIKDYPNHKPLDLIKRLIEAGMDDNFHAKNITSFKYLYFNAQKIVMTAKTKSPKVVSI